MAITSRLLATRLTDSFLRVHERHADRLQRGGSVSGDSVQGNERFPGEIVRQHEIVIHYGEGDARTRPFALSLGDATVEVKGHGSTSSRLRTSPTYYTRL